MLITGGSRGIGAATAVLAAAAGWDVAITYNSQVAAANEIVANCVKQRRSAKAYQCDVSDEAAVVRVFAEAQSDLGPLRCLVNNAGILFEMTRLEDLTADRIRRVLDVNVTGAFLCAREAVRSMSFSHGGAGGSIVNVSSAAAYLGSPNEFIDYAASKGALDTMTIGLAKELADQGVRVNGVQPGLIDTEIHGDAGMPDRVVRLQGNVPLQRGGTPEEVASVILFLAGAESAYMTGANLPVAGGR
jgi:NAD(P)-dependent dehydrogenase (short-subunit alcohol dehydrogenase family)